MRIENGQTVQIPDEEERFLQGQLEVFDIFQRLQLFVRVGAIALKRLFGKLGRYIGLLGFPCCAGRDNRGRRLSTFCERSLGLCCRLCKGSSTVHLELFSLGPALLANLLGGHVYSDERMSQTIQYFGV